MFFRNKISRNGEGPRRRHGEVSLGDTGDLLIVSWLTADRLEAGRTKKAEIKRNAIYRLVGLRHAPMIVVHRVCTLHINES